jgi:hypothetical protein
MLVCALLALTPCGETPDLVVRQWRERGGGRSAAHSFFDAGRRRGFFHDGDTGILCRYERMNMKQARRVAWLFILQLAACNEDAADERVHDSGADASAVDASVPLDASSFVPTCRANDGRCAVCAWTEGQSQRCRVTIFQGGCPDGSVRSRDEACPANPAAACDRSPGYFDPGPSQTFADWDFYYAPIPASAQQACLASPGTLSDDAGARWVTY